MVRNRIGAGVECGKGVNDSRFCPTVFSMRLRDQGALPAAKDSQRQSGTG